MIDLIALLTAVLVGSTSACAGFYLAAYVLKRNEIPAEPVEFDEMAEEVDQTESIIRDD